MIFGSMFLAGTGRNLTSPGEIKNVQVKEDSAVTEVVKKASPAVVSIIISKDLNKIPGYSSSPFDLGPFGFDPFFNNRNSSSSNQPNIQVFLADR